MNQKALEAAIEMAGKVRWITIATADNHGRPHMAAARSMAQVSDHTVAITEWFCPETVKNITTNPLVALTVWDAQADMGFQLQGRVSGQQDTAMMDGFMANEEEAQVIPQVQRRLEVAVDAVLRFTHAQHNDQPL
jgi:hypothetical protein